MSDILTQLALFQFNLVCDRAWIAASVVSIQMVGMMIGCLVAGHICEFLLILHWL